jgi:hypothetical protein
MQTSPRPRPAHQVAAAAFQAGAIGTGKLIPDGLAGGLSVDQLIATLHEVFQPTAWTYTTLTVQSAAAPS